MKDRMTLAMIVLLMSSIGVSAQSVHIDLSSHFDFDAVLGDTTVPL